MERTLLRTNFTFSSPYGEWTDCQVEQLHYAQGGIALRLTHEEHGPIAVATVHLPDLQANEVAIKDYSENEGMYASLLGVNVIKPAHRYLSSGFIERIPVCYLADGET